MVLFKSIAKSIWPTILLGGLLAAQLGGQPVLVAQAAPQPDVAQPRPLSAGLPNISITPSSQQVLLGQDVSFSVTFANGGPDTGYGPFIDVILDTTGAFGAYPGTPAINAYEGLGTIQSSITATYLGSAIPAQDFFVLTFNASGQATHPFARDDTGNFITVTGTPGDTLVVVRLPFGSFTPPQPPPNPSQPPATVDFTVNMSNLADVGTPLSIQARGGYEFGYTPLDDWCCGDDVVPTLSGFTSASVTPILFTVSKTYNGPEDETATGPNFPRQYTVTATIAPGQTLNPFTLTDALPANLQFSSMISPAPASCPSLPSTSSPGGTLTCNLGPASGTVSMTFEYYVPRLDASSGNVIDPNTGDDAISCNQAQGTGTWTPTDSRDTGGSFSEPTALEAGCTNPEHTIAPKSIAIQKGVANFSGGTLAPNTVLEYTLDFQVSDFFAFDNIVVTDVISDGQHFDSSFTPTLQVEGNSYTLIALGFNAANYTIDTSQIGNSGPNPPPDGTDGSTTLIFRVSDEIITRGQPNGRMVGACVDPSPPVGGNPPPDCSVYNNDGKVIKAVTGRIVFHTIVQQNYTDTYPSGDPSVDQGDILNDNVTVGGNVLSTQDLASTGYTEADTSAATLTVPTGTLSKEIYAVYESDGMTIVCGPPGTCPANVEIKPGDHVTYRIQYTLPTGDEENLQFDDYLPLPIFNATEVTTFDAVGQFGQPSVIPVAGHANFGPSDTFYNYTCAPGGTPAGCRAPTITTNAAANGLSFTYGDFNGPTPAPYQVDLLFTVTVSTQPFADRLYLTNEVRGSEGSTQNNSIGSDAIIQLILTEPVLLSEKAAIWTDNPAGVFNPAPPGPVTFLPPANAPRWPFGTTIDSSNVASINSNVRDVDAGDTVSFAITIRNTGSSLKGAFDIIVKDTLPAEFSIPTTGTGLNLQIYYGDRTGPISYTGLGGGGAGSADDIFYNGIQLDDPVGVGVCQAHNPTNTNDVIVITYDLQLRTNVTAGDILNTSTVTHYAGAEGGPTFVPTPGPGQSYPDQLVGEATTTVSGAPVKYIVATSEPSTGVVGGVETVTIGEIIRYRLVVRIPEGFSPNMQVEDLLPPGLIFLNDDTASIGFVSTNGIVSADTGTLPIPAIPSSCNLTGSIADATTPTSLPCPLSDSRNIGSTSSTSVDVDVYASGTNPIFKLGDITNNDQDDNEEYVVIEFNALVHNDILDQNNDGDDRYNSVRVYNGDSPNRYQVGTDSQPLRVHVVEALLTLNKTNDKIAVTVDAGDTVTYTITINNTAPSHTTAFDAHYVDILPAADLTLIPASVSSSSSGGVLGITNTNPSGAGNRVEFTIDSIPVGGQVILTYQATVNNSVTPQQAIDNTGDLTWTSLPGDHGTSPNATGSTTPGNSGDTNGERNGSGGINNYAATDTSTVNIATPQLEKSIYVTSESHTSGSDLTIGEEVTYDILFTIPEGTTPSDQVVDTMPTGPGPTDLRLQVIGTPQVILSGIPSKSDFSGTIGGTSVTVGPVGESVTFTFTNISVPADNNNNNNSILLRFTALVLNVGGNQNTDTLSNTATNQVGSNAPTNSNTVDSQIVEAVLQVNKTVDDNRPAPGQTVHFTLTLAHENPGVVSLADAFDVSLSDVLPAQLDLDASPGAIDMNCSGCTVVNTSDDLTNTVSAIVVHFPLGATLTITFDAIVVSPYPMPIIDNTVTATWTSLPGPKGTGSITPGNSGDTNGERNGSGGINDYIDSDTIRLSETRNLTKNLIATSAPSTGNVGGREQVTIGEILTYQVVLTIPAGSTDTAIITDTLDHGLAFVDCSQMTASANITSTKGSPPVTWVDFNDVNNCRHGTSVGSNPLIQNSGQTITFDLGNITNSDTAPHDITLTYRVVVLDITQNVRNVFLSNSVVWTWATGTLPRVLAPQVEIIEPGLGIDKSVDPTVASPGATITYTIRVFHTPNSQTDAFDVTIFDVVPDGVTYVPGSLQHVTGSGPAPDILDDTGMDPVTGRVRLSAFWYSFPLGTPPSALTESLLQFQATVPDPPISRSITNTANVEWTSLPGPVPAPPATFLSAYEQPDSHERRYEPGSPADIYGVSDSASATVPRAPGTGFAPGEITVLPPQPEDRQYQDLGDLWLEIPHLGVRLPIVGIPVTADGEWDLTWLGDQAGYLDGTAYPTHAGNSVLTAHVYLPDGTPGPFVDLHTLGWGDQVIVHLDGQRYIYEVRQEKIVSPDSTTVFKHEDYPWLTLITCKDYDAATDTYAHRVLVRAVLVKIEADPALSPPSNGR